jgi:pimeloyl-ACP methyl ester carboxylesterase
MAKTEEEEISVMAPKPFVLNVPDQDIVDLKSRLALTRLPDAAPGDPWAFGSSVDYIRELVAYWKDKFDWRAQEAALNAFPQLKVPLSDIDVHYLHVLGVGPNPYPLLLMHGWPGSVYEFLDIIPRLTDPAKFGGDPRDAFTVIAPSLPGYGLSFRPGQTRFALPQMADCLHELMTEVLGFKRFAVQGGDWGAGVASLIGQKYPSSVCGIHLNLLFAPRDPNVVGSSPEDARYAKQLAHWFKEEVGYQQIQGTKPQTLAFALTDSPAGLAAWMVEKFRTWSDCDGIPENAIDRDRMLANISLYWFVVLALLRSPARSALADLASRAGQGAHRLCGFPEGDHRAAARARGENLYRYPPLDRHDEGRPFRRHGAACSTRRGDFSVLPVTAVTC